MPTHAYEVNFDGLIGPTHNYAGLSLGNLASTKNSKTPSNPKEAALQGLEKMWTLAKLGVKQGVLPPHHRPDMATLRSLGFHGNDLQVLSQAQKTAPHLLASCCSASSMWAANMATISPSADSADEHVHFTAANLSNRFHRSLETPTSSRILQALFSNPHHFTHHAPLPNGQNFGDEGAANHTRFYHHPHEKGIQLFVFGRYALQTNTSLSQKFPARQTYEASAAIARLHQLDPERTIFTQQNPDMIDAGIFHNDVISTGYQNIFLYHENAFVNTPKTIEEIRTKFLKTCNREMVFIEAKEKELPLPDLIRSYLFNSQIVTKPDGSIILLAPIECQETPTAKRFLENTVCGKSPIKEIHYLDIRQSMQNGGGPACLRLRVCLTDKELSHIHTPALLTETLYKHLKDWIHKHYRSHLSQEDLASTVLLAESRQALDELTNLLHLPPIYPFQL